MTTTFSRGAARSKAVSRRTALLSAGALVPLAQLAAGVSACSDAETGGKRVQIVTRVTAESLAFSNAFGFEIQLERALVSMGPLRYLAGAPVALRRPLSPALHLLEWFRAVRTAHAHPGHYVEGQTLGEMLEPRVVELAGPAVTFAPGRGVTGVARSARLQFQSPAEGPLARELGDNLVLVEGRATSAERTLAFRAGVSLEQLLDAEGNPTVEGCELHDGDIYEDGTIDLTVSPAVWLDQVDFGKVSLEGAIAQLEPSGTPHKAFVRGLKKAAAYVFRYRPGIAVP